ncbi:ABC transporter ATP-binding protein [Methanocella sp. CWC-04]|uniref:ABC transporter ATP-binding protein n=1 Tax=Methanooceanicella nereidis TaxID=2052831 RepID=A0AAP2W4J7_9EURY|nr:ABC transporter ATP-binding protein [Methanocella sp. CWC-04]MCD1294360.1 ABC transporter ATP-binding protein [Methanocella sp. CWC-04]
MLSIEDLTVEVDGKRILNGVNMSIGEGETHALFGPNGSGKSSLLFTIAGVPKYKVKSGSIVYKRKDITDAPMDERAKLGIGILFQHPPVLRGVKLLDMVRISLEQRNGGVKVKDQEIIELSKKLNLENFLSRDVNLGFSGGEIKRSELLQLLAQAPDFVMLDEPDSGVDLVNIGLVGNTINELLEKDKKTMHRSKSGLIITHFGNILDYVKADKAYVMMKGRVFCQGNPVELLDDIRHNGYGECMTCMKR